MKYMRVWADEAGESHFQEVQTSFDMQQYAPPAPEFGISAPTESERYVFVRFPANWTSGLHPTPRRQLFVMLAGHLMGEASDGEVLELRPGDVLLMEDTTGKRHTARTPDGMEAHGIMIHLE